MKKLILIASIMIAAVQLSKAQTATNFNCTDCSSNTHDLFTELNAGKVIVIAWVMPCGSCGSGALAAQTACSNFASSNPGQVLFYVADDYANTSCTSLSNWCNTNGLTGAAAKFSNSAISMSNYGTAGMPKVVVLGSANHTVYYNQNNAAITTSGIQTAISNALSAIAAGVNEVESTVLNSVSVYPNPSNSTISTLSIKLTKASKVKVEIQNILGQKITEVYNGNLSQGENEIKINTSELTNDTYFVSCSDGTATKKIKLIIVR